MKFQEYLDKTKDIASQEKEVLDLLHDSLAKNPDLDMIQIRAAKNSLQVLIENSIGKGKKTLQHYNCPIAPTRGNDAFHILYEVDGIGSDIYSQLNKAIGFRNAMIHDYMNFNNNILLELIKKKDYLFLIDFLNETPNYPDTIRKRIANYNL